MSLWINKLHALIGQFLEMNSFVLELSELQVIHRIKISITNDAVEKQSTTALFSAPTSPEFLYLCKVLAMKIANDEICDIYNHVIRKEEKYMECRHYEKTIEKKCYVWYKLLKSVVYITHHLMSFSSLFYIGFVTFLSILWSSSSPLQCFFSGTVWNI